MSAESSRAAPRLIVLGLDGADWGIVTPLVERGALPNLARLLEEGVSGPLRSTVPPHTPCAWSTIFTGVNPGKHGIFTFNTLLPGTRQWRLTRSTDRKARALWEILGEDGMTAGVFNVPMTYPVEQVNGWMVSGMIGAPEPNESCFHPLTLRDEVFEILPEFSMKAVKRSGGHYPLDEMQRQMSGRAQVLSALSTRRPTDLLVTVCTYTDAVQHHWSADPTIAEANAGEVLEQVYVNADAILGDMMNSAGSETDILVLSDHGFGPVNLYVNLDRLLADLGWASSRTAVERQVARARDLAHKIARKLGRGNKRDPLVNDISRDIVWSRTRAYSMGTHISLRLILAGREPEGIVSAADYDVALDQMIAELAALEIPKAPWARFEAYRGEDLFHGPYSELMPDLVALATGGQSLTMPRRDYLAGQPAFLTPAEAVALDPDIVRGTHRLDGIIAGWGPSFRSDARIEGATLQDITPTLLHILGRAIPEYMDGKPLLDMLRGGREVTFEQTSPDRDLTDGGENAYTEQDARAIEKRLKSLGYM